MEIFLTFFVPIIIMLVLSGVFAFALSFMDEKMKVKRDPREDEVLKNLAGVNCGACGYAGCAEFAKALVHGEAKVDACAPTSKEGKTNIGKILNLSVDAVKDTFVIVNCAGGNQCKDKFEYQGYGDCKSAEILAGGNKACEVGCMGLGTCVSVCQFDAISLDNKTATVKVNKDKCTSCGLCLSSCPKKLISRIPRTAKVYVACSNTQKASEISKICSVSCIACGMCVKACMQKAIEVKNNLAVIDYDKCNSCGNCVSACPRKCILNYEN